MQYVSWYRKSQKKKKEIMSKERVHEIKKYNAASISDAVDNYIVGRNAERNRKIFKRHYIDGICFEPLSEEYGLSVRQVKNIVYKYDKLLINLIK